MKGLSNTVAILKHSPNVKPFIIIYKPADATLMLISSYHYFQCNNTDEFRFSKYLPKHDNRDKHGHFRDKSETVLRMQIMHFLVT